MDIGTVSRGPMWPVSGESETRQCGALIPMIWREERRAGEGEGKERKRGRG